MDVKDDDTSDESKRDHILYYRSLVRIISDITTEMGQEGEPAIKNHLSDRIDAMEKDKKRIREMFPDVTEEQWEAHEEDGNIS